jgi:hypothetical protein
VQKRRGLWGDLEHRGLCACGGDAVQCMGEVYLQRTNRRVETWLIPGIVDALMHESRLENEVYLSVP